MSDRPGREAPYVLRNEESVSLYFGPASVQSRMLVDDPTALELDYTRAMMACLLLRPQPRTVWMIGLGGGSLVKYMHAHVKSARVVALEIDPQVIALRRDFHIPPDDDRLTVHCADGANYLLTVPEEERVDVLMVDGFVDEGQPEALSTEAFYSSCRRRLSAQGVLVVNLHVDAHTESIYLSRIESVFEGQVRSILSEDRSNRIVFAGYPCRQNARVSELRSQWLHLPEVHQKTLAKVWPELLREYRNNS